MMMFARVRRGLLFVTGIIGSIFVVSVLVRSGSALWQSPEEPCAEQSLTFPMEIPGTNLVAHHLIWYEGGYLEDGSHEYEENVAAIMLENTGAADIECARVILGWGDGAYVFDADMLPRGMPVIVLERSRQPYEEKEWTTCQGVQKVAYDRWDSSLAFSASDISIQITNPTDHTICDVRIYFKDYLQDQKVLMGGIVHSYEAGDIPPHTTITIEPYRFVEGYSKILWIQGKEY